MCMGGGMPKDNSAEIARQQQQAREEAIRRGRESIDQAFTQFNDPYYDTRRQAFLDYYNPQVEDQYADARRALTLNLSRSGNLQSGAGARKFGDLTKAFADAQTNYGNQSMDYVNDLRSNVEGERNKLYQQNLSAADPAAAAQSAIASSGALGVQPSFSPIGDLFAKFADTAAAGIQAEKAGYPGFNTGLFKPSSNAVSVVR